jgi:hypothetical protein
MTDLDVELSNRLARLADAVPVAAAHLDSVHRTAVQARQRVRMAWVTPAIALVTAAIVVGLFGVGPSARAGATSTVRDGDFQLTLRSAKARYTTAEPIDVVGELTYTGASASVVISADDAGPVLLSVREPVFGAIQLGGVSQLMCARSTLTRNTPVVVPFKKAGGFDGEHPQASQFQAYFEDPVFRLPAGTWHIVATAQSPCLGSEASFKLETEIAIVVSDDPNATLGLPAPTPWADKPVYGGDDIGNMDLQVESVHPTYKAGSPIDLDTWYSFAEGPPLATTPFIQEVAFSIVENDPVAAVVRTLAPDTGCGTTTVSPLEERHVRLDDTSVVLIKASDWPDESEAALKRGVLALPVGHWRITAVVRAKFGPCASPTETWEVHASVEFDVIPST